MQSISNVNWKLHLIREHSFFRRGGWFRGIQGSVINFLPAQKRKGQHKFDTLRRWVT